MKFTPKPASHSYRFGFRMVLACLLAWAGAAGLAVEGRSQALEGDKQALIALYNATNGPNWANNHGWLSDEPLSTWFGVHLNEGRVRMLTLHFNQLTGTLPTELGNLSHLADLILGDNQLTGPIPAELGSLSSLRRLDFRNNQLTGLIPAELGDLASLTLLDLSRNQLTGPIPAELGNLSHLESLHLFQNQLTGSIPPELANLVNLTHLNLSANVRWVFESGSYEGGLEGSIPVGLGNLASLKGLFLNFNQLTGPIPQELSRLANLEDLSLFQNQLTGSIPPELGNLATLINLSLSDNQLTGPIPTELGNLDNLWHLGLEGNQLTSPIPTELGRLTNLGVLDLYNNQLTGAIPAALGDLANLESLHLGTNRLTGIIPTELGNLANLRRLHLSGNQLTGPIPTELGSLTNLEHLSLGPNQLTGTIPLALGGLANLKFLHLGTNRLTGTIPPTLGGLANLQSLFLPDNQLDGPIPAELGNLDNLWQLNLSGNRLTGPIPTELGGLASLARLYLRNNKLTGPIPADLGHLSSLSRMSLADNQLTGPIPAELGNLTNLRRLDLSGNQLTGAIPESFTNLTLEYFYFHGNPGLSVPDDVALQEWLDGITDVRDQDYSPSTPFVPVILSSAGRNNSFFTSELTLTNHGTVLATLTYTYTAHIGGGSGIASDYLAPGQQKIIPNAIDYLRTLRVPIPGAGNRIGTLRVEATGFSSSQVGVMVRTTTTVPDGRAGLAYPAISAEDGFDEAVYLCGLRQNAQDRSNVALQNMGTAEAGSIVLRTTVYSGDAADSSPRVLKDLTLGPGGFRQYSGVLGAIANGYVKVERVKGTAPFYAYGVINDQANSDGSFVFPTTASSLDETVGQTLPVIVETGILTSELMVTNFSDVAKTVTFRFRAEAVQTPDKTATVEWTFHPGQQIIVPNIVDMLRKLGAAGVGPAGQTFAGALFATVDMGDMSGIAIGARTGSADGRGGQYGVFYNAVPYGGTFLESARVEALQQNEENRSNLALVNTGEVDDSPSVFQLDIFNGATGMLANTVTGLMVPAGEWHQFNGILGDYAPGIMQGYVRISKMSGNNPFLAYGVINDGGAPGQRSGDGAYLPGRE